MSVAKEEALSPDELRKRLYQTFKNRGVLDTLKTQLRNQLIHELKHPILSGETVPRPVPMKSDSVLVTASNSLVADHLRNSGYEYTLSVFYPECGMGKDKIFTSRDLLQIMKISPRSPLYKSLASSTQKENKGFLMSLLIELTDRHLHGERRDADTQTTSTPAYRESLVDKMKMIDEEYEALRYKGDKWVSYESKLAAYRTEVEAQVQAEMNAKLQHYKDVEMSKVKMEEKDKSRKEILQLRQDMERTYEMKSGALINREKNAIDRLQKQQEIEEKDVYMQRQAVLKEIETVRNREAELRLRMEAFEKTCKIQEEKTKTMEELLRRRELAVKTTEDTYDQKLKNELSRYQLELKEEYTKRTEKLTENEKRNKVETIRMQKESAAIDAKLEEHSRACAELRRLQMELDTSQSQYSLLTQQNELLRERLETMNDYPTLRRERVEQQAQLRLLMKQLEEAQEENQRLRADLGRPSVEQLALQTELRRLESARRLSEEEFDSHRQVLQAQLHNEVERCAQLKAQLIDCEERTQWMTTHAEDIKMQLRQTQLALENEVLRNPKPSLVDRSVLELNPDKLVPPDIYVDRGVLRAWVAGYDDVCEAGVMPSQGRRSRWGRSSSPDSDAELVAGAKARIRELEKEAETLEEAYRNYQQRAVHATVSHMLTPRCLSPQRAPVSPRPHSTQRQHISHQRPRSPQRQQVPPQPCPHSPQHPQVSHRPLSPQHQPPPQRTRAPASPQPRVTFAEDPSQDQYPGPGSGRDFQSLDFSEARFSGDRHPLEGTSSPHRRLSSTPLSLSRSQLHTEPVEEAEVSSVAFPVLSPERQLSPLPLPRGEVACSGDFTSDLSPPRSPQLRSTARGQCSPPQVQQIIFSSSESESSPQPEKITIEDLTEPLPEPSHIPELLLDTAGNEEEALDGPLTVPPSRAPWDLTEAQLQGEVQQTPDEPARQEEEEELRWERERREREEKRQRDKEEAQEKELRELERLEKERLLEEVHQYGEEVGGDEEKEERRGQEELKEAEEPEEKAPSSDKDPLQTYLKMIMEQRLSPHVQIPAGREEPEHRSPEAKSLSDEKDDSVAFSHEDADEFW